MTVRFINQILIQLSVYCFQVPIQIPQSGTKVQKVV